MQEQQVLDLTSEDVLAVNRLQELGFDRAQAAQAFLACDKNELLAANLLMDSGIMVEFGLPAAAKPTITVHSYSQLDLDYKAVGVAKKKFVTFLEYLGVVLPNDVPPAAAVTTTTMEIPSDYDAARDEWRTLWDQERLVTTRSDLMGSVTKKSARATSGFGSKLFHYTDRLVTMVHQDDENKVLVTWLRETYGESETDVLLPDNLQCQTETDQLSTLKHFLEWFRSIFPYYHDRCEACNASWKDDCAKQEPKGESAHCGMETDDTEDTEDDSNRTFVGYVGPSASEREGEASRTELYCCHKCRHFTRFARLNNAKHIVEARRGRCGEYSILLYCLLRALNHECRWVLDWADHVWAEILLRNPENGTKRWVHMDSCEAAVDEPLLYQSWGKKQTYLIALYAPLTLGQSYNVRLIEDVTKAYTTDSMEAILERRGKEQDSVQPSIEQASEDLRKRLGLSPNPWIDL